MTITLPQICIDFTGFGTVCAVAFVAFALGWWGSKISSDREWEASIRRRTDQQINAPWLKMGEPVVVNRIDASETLWKPNPYKEAPSFDPMQWDA